MSDEASPHRPWPHDALWRPLPMGALNDLPHRPPKVTWEEKNPFHLEKCNITYASALLKNRQKVQPALETHWSGVCGPSERRGAAPGSSSVWWGHKQHESEHKDLLSPAAKMTLCFISTRPPEETEAQSIEWCHPGSNWTGWDSNPGPWLYAWDGGVQVTPTSLREIPEGTSPSLCVSTSTPFAGRWYFPNVATIISPCPHALPTSDSDTPLT